MSSNESSHPVVEDVKEGAFNLKEGAANLASDAKHEAQHAVDKVNSQPIVQDAKSQAQQVADKINSQKIVQDAKAEARHVADKVSEAAHRADPRDLTAGSVVNGLKQVDKTILRLNK